MGDIADDHYGYIHDDLERLEMDPDYYGIASLFGGHARSRPEPLLTCPYCRKPGLRWSGSATNGYLFGIAGRHSCHAGLLNDFDEDDIPF